VEESTKDIRILYSTVKESEEGREITRLLPSSFIRLATLLQNWIISFRFDIPVAWWRESALTHFSIISGR